MDREEAARLLDLARSVEANAASPEFPGLIDRLNARAHDIERAIEAFRRIGEPARALDLTGCLSGFWQTVGKVVEGRELTESLLDALCDHPRTAEFARAQLVLGELAFRQGDQEASRTASTIARDIGESLGDGWLEGRAELNLARIAFRDGDAPRIFEHASRVLTFADEFPRLRTAGIHMLGWAEYTAGHAARALALFEENAAAYREAGNARGEASELFNVAGLAMESGDLDRAAVRLRDVLNTAGVTEGNYLLPAFVGTVGALAGLRGSPRECIRLVSASGALYDRFGFTPDPGAGSAEALDRARARVSVREAEALEAEGALMDVPRVIDLVRKVLR